MPRSPLLLALCLLQCLACPAQSQRTTTYGRSVEPARAVPPSTLEKLPQSMSLAGVAGRQVFSFREGTQVAISPKDLMLPDGSAPQAAIRLEVTEYYNLADMARANLTTVAADSTVLSTAGMVKVMAYSGPDALQLRPGANIGVKFALTPEGRGYGLYLSDRAGMEPARWQLDTSRAARLGDTASVLLNPEPEVFTFVERMPEPGYSLENYYRQAMVYPKAARGKEGPVYVDFIVREDGVVDNARITKSLDPALDAEALRLVHAMPAWKPGLQAGRPVPVRISLPIAFKKTATPGVPPPDTVRPRPLPPEFMEQRRRIAAARWLAALAPPLPDMRYSSRLGYLNLDRVLTYRPIANLPAIPPPPNTSALLVYPGLGAVIDGQTDAAGVFIFRNAPLQAPAVLLYIRSEAGQETFSVQPLTPGRDTFAPPEFRPLTKSAMEEVRGMMR